MVVDGSIWHAIKMPQFLIFIWTSLAYQVRQFDESLFNWPNLGGEAANHEWWMDSGQYGEGSLKLVLQLHNLFVTI